MFPLDRRQFLRNASLLLGGGYANSLLAEVPKFAATPEFEPQGLFLTWQHDPTTTMTIQWVGDEKDGRHRPIWYAPEGSEEWRVVETVARPFPMTDKRIFRTELTGLSPDVDYRFRVGLDSAERRFRTMPAKATNTIQFVSGGDCGVSQNAMETNVRAAAQSPRFVVMGGDIAYENADNPEVFLRFLQNYSKQLLDDRQRHIPLLGCIGNHEVIGGYERSRKDAPFFYSIFDGFFTDTGYASLDFGDYLSLVLLDSNHTSPIGGDQADWLEKTLRQREDCPNVFVVNHVPSYPSHRPLDHDDADNDKETCGSASRKHWVPLFERYNVDVVLEHHDHAYKRTHPMLDGKIDPKNGIVYLGDGSWGKIRRPETPETRPYLAVANEAYHFSLHRIEGNQRFHVALSDAGRVVDVCTTSKRRRMKTAKIDS